ncbi:glycerophosphocholine phosphodiesterase GPCPD1 [Musca domestica]|uniref:Glycerophosphocholine phosphodiesterase GPCPD1 n=1 Tax=Musca domestica TaxID=7370 RepID=A0A1I8MCV1_MUSDO|nr:glycerophosphocholine phosphodiesterase GPCPD1 [Musca domestica]
MSLKGKLLPMKLLLLSWGTLSIMATLPTATKCDTSYYEKYYSARRFLPLKKPSLVEVHFQLQLQDEKLQEFEKMAIVGDIDQLGNWKASKAVVMNKTLDFGKWEAVLQIPVNSSFSYRYFVAAQDRATSDLLIRRWESALNARSLSVTTVAVNQTDNFGYISSSGEKELQRGWLNSGHIVQFKLFRNPLALNESLGTSQQQLRIKLTPVDPEWRTAISPSGRAYTEYVRMEYGNSFLRTQPEHGVLYKEDGIIMFHTTVSDLAKVGYLFQLYVEDTDNDLYRLVGYQYLEPELLVKTDGELELSLVSPTWMNAIGSLKLKYVVVHPSPNSSVDFRTSFVEYWRDNWTHLEAGHRGLGKSLKETTNAAPIIENTVATMIATGELGADIVEFDVQLTKDLIPIIYHDFSVFVCIESKTPTSKDDLTEVLIKDVTYEQLKDLTTYQVIGSKIIEYPSHNSVKDENHRLFPTFEDFLTKVNKSVGFDIEIKWPQLKSNGVWESKQTIDKNVYIDRILAVMMEHGCGRLSFFTSFDADICTMLRYKQNMYPVMFLSSSKEANFVDPRSDTIYDSVNNAQAFELAGIVPNAVFIKNNPAWIEVARAQQKKVFLWGGDLKDRESIDWFLAQNPTGVIYDRMDLYLTANRTSAFEKEPDLPEFFELQCSPSGGQGSGENATITQILSNVNML